MKKRKLLRLFILLIGCIIIAVSAFAESKGASCVISYSSVEVTNRNGCSSTNDGSICVTISYTGLPLNNQFDLSINNGVTWTSGAAGVSTLCVDNLAAGIYKLVIRDRFGCTTTYSGNPVTLYYDICIPDANFKAILVSDTLINTNRDAEIQRSEAVAFTGEIDAGSASIADLTGLEEFVNISIFSCSGNPSISEIDLSKNIALQRLYSDNCSIEELDLSNNPLLIHLVCIRNNLAVLDLSHNPLLDRVFCYENQINSIDLTNNPLLERLYCYSNIIEQLDISANPALEYLKCSDNLLNHLNLKNGNNTNITTLDCTSNPDLNCVLVDDVAYAETNWVSYFDAGVNFSLDCNPIPEDETIANVNFDDGDTTCIGAYQTITVGDVDENLVYFDYGSSTSLIAGSSITFLPGVHIHDGAYLSATITTDSSFCDVAGALGSPVVAAEKTEKSKKESEIHKDAGDALLMQSLKVFPNPNNGNFQIEIETTDALVDFIISNSLGLKVFSGKLANGAIHLNLTTLTKGIYFIRTTNTRTPITRKMVVR